MKIKDWLKRYRASFSSVGLILAILFFSASLSPSMVPRSYTVQGTLSGVALAVGYGFGIFSVWLWRYLEMPEPANNYRRWFEWGLSLGAGLVAFWFLWRTNIWQNSIRALMEMEPLTTAHPWRVGSIAVSLALVLVTAGRFLGWKCRLIARKLNTIVPRRVSYVLSFIIAALILVSVTNGILIKNALRLADEAFEQMDALVDEGIEQPTISTASGSANSLISWDSIGRRGKNFVVSGPSRAKLSQFSDYEAQQPLRVYVGLRSRETIKERAKLALEELKRIGAFQRAVLVVATPTGTGWLDPSAVDTLEYLHAGNSAIVSIQYSYLPSWLTLLVDPDRSRVAARALFNEIYSHWVTLPQHNRPRFYLHGLSLGALGSESSTELFLILDDLVHGAVWSGPPFPSRVWSAVTKGREPDSPAWLPRVRDGSFIRFTGRKNGLVLPDARWGPMRIVYIQHASDPMTFFSPDILFRKPDWMMGDRGPDVTPYVQWYPIISFLQIGFDLPIATSVPLGYGHNFAPASYIDAWIAVTEPEGWTGNDTERLKRLFTN